MRVRKPEGKRKRKWEREERKERKEREMWLCVSCLAVLNNAGRDETGRDKTKQTQNDGGNTAQTSGTRGLGAHGAARRFI